jgi:hypothetical protein
MKKILTALIAALALVLGTPLAASATEQTGYIVVAWNATEGDIWNPAQTYEIHVEIDTPDLNALDALLPCGGYFQIDVNTDTQIIRDTIAGKVLVGPNNPGESLIPGGEGVAWKFVKTAACVSAPEPRVFADSHDDATCELVTTTTREGIFELDFDRVANRWTERLEPTITAEASSQRATTLAERQALNCVEEEITTTTKTDELADTGPASFTGWLLPVGGLALLAGIGAVIVARRARITH